MKQDIAMAIVGLIGLAAFLGIIIWRVPEVPLITVFVLVFLMAAFDFWRQLRADSQNRR